MSDYRTQAKIGALEAQMRQLRRDRDVGEVERMAHAQARCDAVLAPWGERAPSPSAMDDELSFRQALMNTMAKRSKQFAQSRFDGQPREIIDVIEPRLYAELGETARHDARQPGTLVAFKHRDPAGREITRFEGDIAACFGPFMATGMTCNVQRPTGKLQK